MTANEIYDSISAELEHANASGNMHYIVFLTLHLCTAQKEITRALAERCRTCG